MRLNENKPITDVAIYLRKSRAEETEKDLEKHRVTLEDICTHKKWKSTLYEEIGSSASIDSRPKMVELLKDVESGLYDAVLVMDQDRLSRGDGRDATRVKEAFERSGTILILANNREVDLTIEQDNMLFDITAMFANWELKMINRRFRRGKAAGARLGRWTNGIAPFPYIYVPEKKELLVDEADLKLYRWILEKYISGEMSSNDISYTLNGRMQLTRKGRHWTNKVILDLIKDETHLGKIIKGKTKKVFCKEKNQRIEVKCPKEEWVYYDGLHEAVKTQEEHEAVLQRIARSTLQPNKKGYNTADIYPLSKLVKCGICGCTLRLNQRDINHAVRIHNCWKKDKFGNKCPNLSSDIGPILVELNNRIIAHIQNIEVELESITAKRAAEIDGQISIYEQKLGSKEQALLRIREAYENGVYSLDEVATRKPIAMAEIDRLKNIIGALRQERLNLAIEVSVEKLNLLRSFEAIIANEDLSYEELNSLYRSIIESIYYTRENDGTVTLSIEYK